ncbi:MAG: hypothetical protein ABEJ57_07780 [Halobacteriaceae archaeon]
MAADVLQVDPTSLSVTPAPTRAAESLPPIWYWDRPRYEAEARFSITVAADAQPTDITYGVTAANGDEERTAFFTITITGP